MVAAEFTDITETTSLNKPVAAAAKIFYEHFLLQNS